VLDIGLIGEMDADHRVPENPSDVHRSSDLAERPCDTGTSEQRVRARVQLLNGFGCFIGSQEFVLSHGPQRLVAFLGLMDQPHTRLALCRILWPDLDQDHALAALRTTVWRLNRVCPGLLAHDHSGLRLDADVDARTLLAEATAMLSGTSADSQCRGFGPTIAAFRSCLDLLPGWYDDWVLFHRERLLAVRVELLHWAAARLLADRHLPEALDLAFAALAADSLDERTHLLLVSIHLAHGNTSEAIRQYRLCADMFARELGIAPSDRFTTLVLGERQDHEGTRH
jgi:DNA-binding SARP family transcriptional activator